MITILFHMTVKPECEEECAVLAKDQMARTGTQDEGCINYTFYRQSNSSRDLVLFEQWRDLGSLNAHIARLQRELGPPDDQEPHPETDHRRRLPKAFLALFEKTHAVRYDELA